jgi:hypothetical protein
MARLSRKSPSINETETHDSKPGFRKALVERLQATYEMATNEERRLIHGMILWLKGRARS